MTVIYLFVSPSGRAYAGRHTCQHEGWPRRGSGALPSGYRGSGKLWANVTRRHGPAIRWIILRRFGPDAARADIDAAERRAIRLARHLWAGQCTNVLEGGEGLTSADARALWAEPGRKAQMAATQREVQNKPDVKARMRAALITTLRQPETRAKKSASATEAMARPDVKALHSDAVRQAKNRPEARIQIRAKQVAITLTPEGAATLARAQAAGHTPEAIAKAKATRARNKALRAMETQQ